MSEGMSAERIDHITGCLNGPDVAGLAKGFARELLAEVKRLRGENGRQRTTNRDLGKHTMRTMERATAAETEAKQLRARLDEIGETREEWGQKYSGGGYLTRVDSDWMRERWPIEQWAWDNTRHGGVVGKRTIIVVEDWQDIRSDDLPKDRPAETRREVPDA